MSEESVCRLAFVRMGPFPIPNRLLTLHLAKAMPDLVEEGRSGHLVPPGDPDALEQALLRLVEDAELRRRMGERGRERAVTDFSGDGVADRVARLILAELDSHTVAGVALPSIDAANPSCPHHAIHLLVHVEDAHLLARIQRESIEAA
ncbi:MAG: glycosyltransferase [Deltaproteobacteria bacterium]|nr:glycosyltransferase [Deltaproteobacteria bacterium]